jgi:hypothetical protein
MRDAVLIKQLQQLVKELTRRNKKKSTKVIEANRRGGLSRAQRLSPERRREISRHANAVRWHKEGAK